MAWWNKKDKDDVDMSEAETERRDRASVSSAAGNAGRRRKDVMDAWKNMIKGQGKDWIERLIFLVKVDLEQGGVAVPSDLSEALDSSAAIMQMADSASGAVRDIAQENIKVNQEMAMQSSRYLSELDADIRAAEAQLAQVRVENKQEAINLAKARRDYENWLIDYEDKMKGGGDPPLPAPAADNIPPDPPTMLEPEVPGLETVAEPVVVPVPGEAPDESGKKKKPRDRTPVKLQDSRIR